MSPVVSLAARQCVDHALESRAARTLDEHADLARQLGVDRARQRLAVREPLRAGAESLDSQRRQLAGGEQPVDVVIAREAADLLVTGVGEVAEFGRASCRERVFRVV